MRKTYLILEFVARLLLVLSIVTFFLGNIVDEKSFYSHGYAETPMSGLSVLLFPLLGFIQFLIFSSILIIIFFLKRIIKGPEVFYKSGTFIIITAIVSFIIIAAFFLLAGAF